MSSTLCDNINVYVNINVSFFFSLSFSCHLFELFSHAGFCLGVSATTSRIDKVIKDHDNSLKQWKMNRQGTTKSQGMENEYKVIDDHDNGLKEWKMNRQGY